MATCLLPLPPALAVRPSLFSDDKAVVGICSRGSFAACCAKKKTSFVDQILDYIEGGPKLRKWYGAAELLPKDGSVLGVDSQDEEDKDLSDEEEVRDAVLVTDGDSELGQMVILSLIVKRARVKALVKDKRAALEAFGTYVESMPKDASDGASLRKVLRGVRSIICPNEGFLSGAGSLKGVKHVILLSQLSVYSSASGIQSMFTGSAKKLAEQDESALINSGVPYTIVRTGVLKNTPGGTQGFSFDKGCAASGSISKEDAAFICVEALDVVPQKGFVMEVTNTRSQSDAESLVTAHWSSFHLSFLCPQVANGEESVSNWKDLFAAMIEEAASAM